jgi:hypothetical protein
MVLGPAVTGVTLDPLPAGAASRFDRATSFRVQLDQGALASVTELALLGGANAAAIQNDNGAWEVLQFQSAVLTAPATYALSGFVRGQAGTEHAMRSALAAGARFVVLDTAISQVDITEDEIGLALGELDNHHEHHRNGNDQNTDVSQEEVIQGRLRASGGDGFAHDLCSIHLTLLHSNLLSCHLRGGVNQIRCLRSSCGSTSR